MSHYIEEAIMLAAIENDGAKAMRLLRSMYPTERKTMLRACDRIYAWADEIGDDG